MNSRPRIVVAIFAGAAMTALALAQDAGPPPAGAPGAPAAGRGGRGASASPAFPTQPRRTGFTQYTRPLAPQDVLLRGKAVYEANCATSCHAADLRGSANGANLLRSENTLRDKKGELVAEAIAKHNPAISLSAADSLAIAEYIHAVQATMGGQGSPPGRNPVGLTYNILVGDVKAGESYFGRACANCHSVTGDLKGIGARYSDPRELQNTWVEGLGSGGESGRGGRGGVDMGNLAVVTMPDGSKLEGKLERKTEWLVVLTLADGTRRSIRRNNDIPKVETKDPNEAHKKMALAMDDPNNKNMHDVTAYLATLK